MQDGDIWAALRQRLLDEVLAVGAVAPARFVLWCILQREDHAAQTRMTRAYARVASGLSTLVLTSRTCTGRAAHGTGRSHRGQVRGARPRHRSSIRRHVGARGPSADA